ncbi:MAG: bifunctional phosphopantothenoylcysteine decarboxylase/phosphopantothenate--cysteine ligase CoaBC [Calditrichota bacterium]
MPITITPNMFPTDQLKNKHITVGITGCIAAYKSCYLIRYLVKQGAEVRAILTNGGSQFITPLILETLTNHPVYSDMFPQDRFVATHHIELADWTEAAIVVPATANILAKAANGISDDFLSTVICALHCPTVFAPAMNTHMWTNPATLRNLQTLRSDGYLICDPEEGFLAEGYDGVGRLAAQEYLENYMYYATHPLPESLKGKRVLITAGATREYLDPARMLTNPSTGKMGFALALDARARGADVVLVHGESSLIPPREIRSIAVKSAHEMFEAVDGEFDKCDIFIGAAAVADYTPANYSISKLKKQETEFTLELERTIDIIKTMSQRKKSGQITVGFAVETDDPLKNAEKKMTSKNLDMVVLNNPNDSGAGFAVDTNSVQIIRENKPLKATSGFKLDVARSILECICGEMNV